MSTGYTGVDLALAFVALYCAMYCTVNGLRNFVNGIRRMMQK
jgi:hypothetical protein